VRLVPQRHARSSDAKTDFPAFAIFGRNLVPACKCNSKRSTLLIGPNPGERILHPYYDDVLGERLFRSAPK